MQTTTSTRASTAQAVADHSPQRRPPRRAVEPDAAVAAAITAPTAAHPRALPNPVAVLKTPEARPRSSSPTLSVTATVRGTLAITKPASANSGPSRERSDAVGRIFGEFPLVVRFGEGSGPELVSGVKGALGTILADVVVASSKGTWARIKICAAEDCRWAYYDHSKSRSGRWCAMETCGNRHKTRRYRRKNRTSAWQGG